MRRIGLWVLLLVLAAGFVVACEQKETTTSTTINITGPFAQCTVIILPDGKVVTFGDRDVGVRDGNTITVGQTVYNIDLDSCAASTVTTTKTGGAT